jgi:sigma-E factor negative regulatory protein RseC
MIEAGATVVGRGPGMVEVETVRRSACSGCASSVGCAPALLGGLFAPGVQRFTAEDPVGAAIGERVLIGIPDGLLVRASLAAYLLPLGALVVAAAIAQSQQVPEPLVAAAGIAGLGAGLWLIGRWTGGSAARRRFRPVVLRRESPIAFAHFEIPDLREGAHEESAPR